MIFAKGVLESEVILDKSFCLDTNGRYDKCSNFDRAPYEPTLYSVLDAIVESDLISANDRLVDFGSGKGRATIYLSAKANCDAIGVEFVEELYRVSIKNTQTTCLEHHASFTNILAENYLIDDKDTCFYFANPFSVNVFKIVLNNICDSLRKNPRKVKLFFHYISKEYFDFLSSEHCMKHISTIDCRKLFCEYTGKENVIVYEIISSERKN